MLLGKLRYIQKWHKRSKEAVVNSGLYGLEPNYSDIFIHKQWGLKY